MKKVDFSRSWALVTGASSGLGAEFAKQLGHRGANLVLTARSKDRLERLADDLARVNGIQTRVIVSDLAASDGISSLLASIDALNLPISHVVNNAGFGSTGPFASSDPEVERRMVRLNTEAVVAIARHFLPGLLARRSGGLIQVASTSAFQPTPFMTTYGASKAFVLSFSLSLVEETRRSGVRVLALCPGPVPTGFQDVAGVQSTALFKFAALDARRVVEDALQAYDVGRNVCVPGTLNALQTNAVKVLPRGLLLRAARWAMYGLGRPGSE